MYVHLGLAHHHKVLFAFPDDCDWSLEALGYSFGFGNGYGSGHAPFRGAGFSAFAFAFFRHGLSNLCIRPTSRAIIFLLAIFAFFALILHVLLELPYQWSCAFRFFLWQGITFSSSVARSVCALSSFLSGGIGGGLYSVGSSMSLFVVYVFLLSPFFQPMMLIFPP